VRDDLATRISPAAADFRKLSVRQPHGTHMLDIIKERTRCRILIVGRQLPDLAQGLFSIA
jgi:hypothetical protein